MYFLGIGEARLFTCRMPFL